MILPIVAGRLRGRLWHLGSRGKVLRVLGGSYERPQTRLFERTIRPGATVLDVGAHVGYYTLLAAELAGERGRIRAYEPDPRNAGCLRRHVRLNRLGMVEVIEAAVAERDGVAAFAVGSGTGTGHLGGSGPLRVRTVSLDEECARESLRPSAIKIDVEGAELAVLRGATGTLSHARPVLFLSTHGEGVHARCLDFLEGAGYRCEPVDDERLERARELFCTPR